MKAIVIDRYGSNEKVRVADMPEPALGPRDVLVEVHAASVNPIDFKTRDGRLRPVFTYRFPLVLGNDLSGVVRAVGPEVTRFRPGDAVYARTDKRRLGAFAELAAVREEHLALKPARLSHAEAAALPLVGLTAWQALVELGEARPGQKALIHAGGGGVGSVAIQIAKHRGMSVATTASPRTEAFVRSLGADVVVDYTRENFWEVLKDYDFALDVFGGATRARTFRALRRGGTLVSIDGLPDVRFARAQKLNRALWPALGAANVPTWVRARTRGVRYRYLFMRESGAQLAELSALVDQGALRPAVERTFALEDTGAALAAVEGGRTRGKVVIAVKPGAN